MTGARMELTPSWLQLACLLAGRRPPDLRDTFRYAHLGSGAAATPCAVAASHPQSEVWAWDLRPEGIEATRSLATELGLSNLEVCERMAALPDLGARLHDIVAVDGLAPVPNGGPAEDGQFLAAAVAGVRPGGLLAVRYPTTVGWAEVEPVLHLVRHLVVSSRRERRYAVRDALDLVEHLRDKGASYLAQRPAVTAWLDEIAALDVDEFDTTYLDPTFRPTSHAAVASAIENLGLVAIGSADLGRPLAPDLPADLAAVIGAARDPRLHEASRDLASPVPHRTDLFRLGEGRLSEEEQHAALAAVRLVDHRGDPIESGDDPAAIRRLLANGEAHPT